MPDGMMLLLVPLLLQAMGGVVFAGDDIDLSSRGKDNPLIPAGDQGAEPRNRRMEVTVR